MTGGVAALEELWRVIGGPPDAISRLAMVGPLHVLPSVFDVTGLASASVAAAHLAAAELYCEVRGQSQLVTVDRRHAAIAFRSERHCTIDGQSPPPAWDAASGYHPTRDGRLVQVHANFPHHRSGLLEELGIGPDPGDDRVADAVGAEIAERDGEELESALGRRGMCASMLRSMDEWSVHPHAAAVENIPLIEIERIGDAPVESVGTVDSVLGAARILDLTRVIAGPVCSRTLAAHGAKVLRVGARHLPAVEGILADTLIGKRSTFLDLAEGDDHEAMTELLRSADVLVQSYRPGALAALGLGPSDAAQIRPGIVYASLSAYSETGPWGGRRGFDSLVQTATGIGHAGAVACGMNQPATRPLPAQALDHGSGWILAAGVMEALRRRALEGGSWHVRTSLISVRNFLVSLGTVDGLDFHDPSQAEIADLLTSTSGRSSTIGHVAVPGSLSVSPPGWSEAGRPLGGDRPKWWAAD